MEEVWKCGKCGTLAKQDANGNHWCPICESPERIAAAIKELDEGKGVPFEEVLTESLGRAQERIAVLERRLAAIAEMHECPYCTPCFSSERGDLCHECRVRAIATGQRDAELAKGE